MLQVATYLAMLVSLCFVVISSCCAIVTVRADLPAAMVFQAVQFLRPLPPAWSASVPLDQWGAAVLQDCPVSSTTDLFTLYIDAALAATFVENNTLRIDLLPADAPLCAVMVDESASPLSVTVNMAALPTALMAFVVPGSALTTVNAISSRALNLTTLPVNFTWLNVAGTNVEGVIDLTKIQAPFQTHTFVANFSHNPGIFGGVDLVQQGLCGRFPSSIFEFQIDLTNTSISRLFVAVEAAGQYCVEGQAEPGGYAATVFIDVERVNVTVVETQPFPFTISYGYYCLPPYSEGDNTNLPVMQFVHEAGLDMIKMMSPPYECTMVLTSRFATYASGYIYGSPAYAMGLWPCMRSTTSFAAKTAAVGYEIAVHDPTLPLPLIYGMCPDPVSDQGNNDYFSVSLGEHIFFDFISTGLNVTSRGYHNGTFRECYFDWHYFVDISINGNNEHIIYNDAQLIQDLQRCLPTADPSGQPFGIWQRATLSTNENRLFFRDTIGNTLTLHRFNNTVVLPSVAYCHTTPTLLYSWNVSYFSSTITVTVPNGTVVRQCSYDGILQFITREYPSDKNIFYNLDGVMASLSGCLPLSPTGIVRRWSATQSHVALAPGSFIFGDLLLVDADSNETFGFSNSSCALIPPAGTYCSSVDLFTGSLLLTIEDNRSASLAYYRRSQDRTLQNVTFCPLLSVPVVFDVSGNAFFLGNITSALSSCFPLHSNEAAFGRVLTAFTFNSATVGFEMVTNNVSAIGLISEACDSLPIPPDTAQMCPELPIFNDTLAQAELCFGSFCRPFRAIEWTPTSAATDGDATWTTSSSALQDNQHYLSEFSQVANISGGTISTCYPTCFVDTTSCAQLAYLLTKILTCYVKKGLLVTDAALPFVSATCLSHPAVLMILQMIVVEAIAPRSAVVDVECIGSSGAAFVARPPVGSETKYVVATSFGVSVYRDPFGNTWNGPSGLTAHCTTCQSLWMQKLYPTPLGIIALNAVVNMILVIVANYVVQPLVGPRIAKIKVKFLVALGALSRREVANYETWLLRCLKPYIASASEIKFHVDSVCKIVNVERKKIQGSDRFYSDDDDDEADAEDRTRDSNDTPSASYLGTTQEPEATRTVQFNIPSEGNHGTITGRASSNRRSKGSPRQSSRVRPFEETQEEKEEADAKFKMIYERHIMRGVRMLGGVSEISLRKLVDLRDACSAKPIGAGRTTLLRFPTRKTHDSYMTEMTAENLLLLNHRQQTDAESPDAHYDILYDPDSFGVSNASLATVDVVLEDSIASVDADTTAEWVPFVLSHEWMDRQFLSPKDWLLLIQTIYLLVVFGRVFDVAVTEAGATSSWEVYSAFYFFLIGSSSPVSLIVNAVFRVLYARNVGVDATDELKGKEATVVSLAKAYSRELIRDPFFMVPFLMTLPALCSHVITGLVMFPFLLVGSIALVKIAGALRTSVSEVDYEKGKLKTLSGRTLLCVLTRIIYRQVVMFVCVASVQFAFSYAMLAYLADGPAIDWVHIVETDYSARSVSCVLQEVQRSTVSAWNLFYAQFS